MLRILALCACFSATAIAADPKPLDISKPELLKDKQVGRVVGTFTPVAIHPAVKRDPKAKSSGVSMLIDGQFVDSKFFDGSIQVTKVDGPLVLIRMKTDGFKAGESFEFDEMVTVTIHKFTSEVPEELRGKKPKYATIWVLTPKPKK